MGVDVLVGPWGWPNIGRQVSVYLCVARLLRLPTRWPLYILRSRYTEMGTSEIFHQHQRGEASFTWSQTIEDTVGYNKSDFKSLEENWNIASSVSIGTSLKLAYLSSLPLKHSSHSLQATVVPALEPNKKIGVRRIKMRRKSQSQWNLARVSTSGSTG